MRVFPALLKAPCLLISFTANMPAVESDGFKASVIFPPKHMVYTVDNSFSGGYLVGGLSLLRN